MKILVTGASGFIGSVVCAKACEFEHEVVSLIRDSDNRHQRRFYRMFPDGFPDSLRVVKGDLRDLQSMSGLCEGVDVVINCAARTFVDHSILDPRPFIESNVVGTLNLLEDARRYKVKRFIQVSTDEVYGAILEGAYTEDARLNPTNPYAASKAGADCLAISYAHTFGLHTVVSRTENNYGPAQHPQKVFPVFVKRLLDGKKLPVYGDGQHVRQWLYVTDHARALLMLALHPEVKPGEIYHVAGNQELTNLELAQKIVEAFRGNSSPFVVEDWVEFIPDHNIRPGHDRRYALQFQKMRALGWEPQVLLSAGIQMAVEWYQRNPSWLR